MICTDNNTFSPIVVVQVEKCISEEELDNVKLSKGLITINLASMTCYGFSDQIML